MSSSKERILSLLPHIFFPPAVPQQEDMCEGFDAALTQMVYEELRAFASLAPTANRCEVEAVATAMNSMRIVHSPEGFIRQNEMQAALDSLKSERSLLVLHIRAQNAGVTISKVQQGYLFESFELSPTNDAAMTQGRLRRDFPAQAVKIPNVVFMEKAFKTTVVQTLAKMSHQPVAGTRPQVRKAHELHDEDRDTVHPGCVTELFTGFLGAIGDVVDIDVVTKNTRETVAWREARAPWRRSPVWLLIRVAMQLAWRTTPDSSERDSLYKTFMAFFMSRILRRSQQHDIESDMLFVMQAKLERRMCKLGVLLPESMRDAMMLATAENHRTLKDRWSLAQAKDGRHLPLHKLSTVDYHTDTRLHLSELDGFISDLEALESSNRAVPFVPSRDFPMYPSDGPPSLDFDTSGQYGIWNLQRFENWVATCLHTWCKPRASEDLCREIGDLIARYHSRATQHYSDNAESLSVMLLTIFELWIAGDRAAIGRCVLLQQFDPVFPAEILQSLLLPFRSQMEQLSRIEDYLSNRRSNSLRSILLPADDPNCFAAKYFDQSKQHQQLRKQIEKKAYREKEEKLEELACLKSQYERLMLQCRDCSCEYREIQRKTSNVLGEARWVSERIHSANCRKCDLEHQANALKITVHEWPLPNCSTVCKTVLFELDSPNFFAAWRDATMYLQLDVLKSEYKPVNTPRTHCLLTEDGHLKRYLSSSSQRIVLLSEDKLHIRTHRSAKKVSTASADSVCLRNGSNYRYFDVAKRCIVQRLGPTEVIPQRCTLQLNNTALQRFIFRPAVNASGPPHNEIIASQSDCPPDLALEEYIALCSIPLGNRIQWLNLLRELAAPSIDLKRHETALVIWQCIYQAGPAAQNGHVVRESHAVVDIIERICETLSDALHRLKGNWDSASGLGILVSIAARVLALHPELGSQHPLTGFLGKACEICFAWVNTLRARALHASSNSEHVELLSKCVEVALVCASCFDLQGSLLEATLHDPRHASILIQCAIIICNSNTELSLGSDIPSRILSMRVRRLLHRSYRALSASQEGIHDAITQSWSAYRSCGDWVAVPDHDHWLMTKSAPEGIIEMLTVHYNLLTGELLVDGVPLGHLPYDYKQHPLYAVLFGHAIVEVMPSSVPGMRYSTKSDWNGYNIHLGLRKSQRSKGDLLIRASDEKQTFFAVPPDVFERHLPESFVKDYVHWLNLADRTVQFRPVNQPWNASSSDNWTMTQIAESRLWELSRADHALIGLQTRAARIVGDILAPLASLSHIHMTLHDDQVDVTIPASRTSFHFTRGADEVYSKQFPGMIVQTDQSLGTLAGMKNKLVLREKNGDRRSVLIPEGLVNWRKDCVWVDVDRSAIVHHYVINSYLGRLDDNGSLHSKIYLAYLHALTSFCLPDPLTRRTGGEQALLILHSAAVMSIHPSQTDIDLLEKVAQLSPRRSFYPSNERVMESIEWDSCLGFLAQRPDYYTVVESILASAEQYQGLFLKKNLLKWPRFDRISFLEKRACLRFATLCVSGFGAEQFTTAFDVSYAARDSASEFGSRYQAQAIASLVSQGFENLAWSPPIVSTFWDAMCQLNVPVIDSDALQEKTAYRYDASLLQDHRPVLSQWLVHHRQLNAMTHAHRFDVMIWLASLVFPSKRDTASLSILQLLALFYTETRIAHVKLPTSASFNPSRGYAIQRNVLQQHANSRRICFGREAPEARLPRNKNEKDEAFDARRKKIFQSNRDQAANAFVVHLLSQELSPAPSSPCVDASYIRVEEAMHDVRASFKSWSDNLRLFRYVEKIVEIARSLSWRLPPTRLNQRRKQPSTHRERAFPSIQSAFELPAPLDIQGLSIPRLQGEEFHNKDCEPLPILESLVSGLLALGGSDFEREYIEHLEKCIDHYQPQTTVFQQGLQPLSKHREDCAAHVRQIYDALLAAASLDGSGILHPRWSPILFLDQLSRAKWKRLRKDWKASIVAYGVALTALQRADRLLRAVALKRDDDLVKELRNPGHGNWDPMRFPDSLLLEVESNILIRDTQETIAAEMRSPTLARNAVMQLNMGEGKSAVIMPIVAAALADGNQLVRIIVPRPQLSQMAHVLQSKLGGMLHRRIYFLPVTRDCRLDESAIRAITARCQECQDQGGVLLHQPEDLLSLQLMGPESFIAGRTDLGVALGDLQKKLDQTTRDLVDESDEVFSVKFELIYTMGTQRGIELGSQRWSTIQQVFSRVLDVLPGLHDEMPLGVELSHRQPGQATRFTISQSAAGNRLIALVAQSICQTGLDGFPITRQPESYRARVYTYLTVADLEQAQIDAVEELGPAGFCTGTIKGILMLLRGLLAGGVLVFVLSQKRWRVDYGLAPDRSPATHLAVPYAAKDIPTPRSEFSHPEVVMLLTSLCYYYQGLSDDELLSTFRQLFRTDQRENEYGAWVRDAAQVPLKFRNLQGVNMRDRQQCCTQVFPLFRKAKSVVDFYLANIVFPKEMKEFPHKLSASGWDVGKPKERPSTGFSGTNDSRLLLPLEVEYLHLPSQQATNALVLAHLLSHKHCVVDIRKDDHASDAERVLATVEGLNPSARVILDAGAQILELENLEVAEHWLRANTDKDVEAVVFFHHDDLSVVDRHGYVELFQVSSYASRLDVCLVYLDQAHTRGTDLKLPHDYRAAVTLGDALTKDQLAQACMRMRQLGKGQTVTFCIPSKVRKQIETCVNKEVEAHLNVMDVLLWSIRGAWTQIRRHVLLWDIQGRRFDRQRTLWSEAGSKGARSLRAHDLLEADAQSLEQRYRPSSAKTLVTSTMRTSSYTQRIEARRRYFGTIDQSGHLSEEQVRELAPEIEQEPELQRAQPAQPARQSLHPDVKRFVSEGFPIPRSRGYMPAFAALNDLGAAVQFEPSQLIGNGRLLASTDFIQTVQRDRTPFVSDDFQRPVQWVLSSAAKDVQYLMIISPFEAQRLIERVRHSCVVGLHLYKPRVQREYHILDRLDYVTVTARKCLQIPQDLLLQLNLFAGQLYFDSLDDVKALCSSLGLQVDVAPDGWVVAPDGFVVSDEAGRTGLNSGLASSPVPFLKDLVRARRKGQGIKNTHLGQILEGNLLRECDFAP